MSKTNSHLGRGLESLLPSNFDKTILLNSDERIQNVFLSDIAPNPGQPRKHFDEGAISDLAASIKQHGVLQPIIVAPAGKGYEIIAGERRWRASKQAGLKSIPAIVREKKEQDRLEMALIENVQRVDLSALEQAVSIEHLHTQFNMNYQQIADKLGKALSTVSNLARLLQLPEKARDALQEGRITEGHARAILALKDQPEAQDRLLQLIEGQAWSVRQAEQFVTAHKEGIKTTTVVKQRTVRETPQTKKLSGYLGSKVTIHHTAKGGRLEIHFKSDDELNDLYKKLER